MIAAFIDVTSLLIMIVSGRALHIAEQHDLVYHLSAIQRRRLEGVAERANCQEILHTLSHKERLSDTFTRGDSRDVLALSSPLGINVAGLAAAALTQTESSVFVSDDVRTLRLLHAERPQLQLVTSLYLLKEALHGCPDSEARKVLEKVSPWFKPHRAHPEAQWWDTHSRAEK